MRYVVLTSILLSVLSLTNAAQADTPQSNAQTSQIYIGTEPVSLALGGYAIRLKRSSTFLDNLAVGVGHLTLELPKFMIDLDDKNKGKGWEVELEHGFDLFADYHFSDPNKGWLAGAQVSLYDLKAQRLGVEEDFQNLVGIVRIGYLWRPWDSHFYLMPWFGAIFTRKISGKDTIEGETYNFDSIAFFPSLAFGVSL